MEIMIFSEVAHFKNNLATFLQTHEALNCRLIGTLLQSNESTFLSLGTCCQNAHTEFAWILTKDKILMLTEGNESSLHLLTDLFIKNSQDICKISGPTHLIDTFVRLMGLRLCKSMMQNVYQIEKMPSTEDLGHLRKAELSDITFLEQWIEQYIIETNLDHIDANLLLKKLIREERLFLLENDHKIVSMAACVGPTFTGIRIGLVFTPQSDRGKGYASSCVSALISLLLKQGFKKCFLFADSENSTANSIYKKIGFELMGSYKDGTLLKVDKIS